MRKSAQATDDVIPAETPDHDQTEEHPDDAPNANDQQGVRDVEAVTLSWTRLSLILVFLK